MFSIVLVDRNVAVIIKCRRESYIEMKCQEKQYEYDVVLSFAGAQREYVERVKNALSKYEISVFYDNDNSVELWGKNLYEYLADIYTNKALFLVMFISKEYSERPWTIHESRAAQERRFHDYNINEYQEYVLPVKFDDTEIPGIRNITGYMNAHDFLPEELAEKIVQKIKERKAQTINSLSINSVFKEIVTMMEELPKKYSYLQFQHLKDYAEITVIDDNHSIIAVQLIEKYIHVFFYKGKIQNNPSIIIFLNKENLETPIKILNFSLYLKTVPEKDYNYNEFRDLFNKTLLYIVRDNDETL